MQPELSHATMATTRGGGGAGITWYKQQGCHEGHDQQDEGRGDEGPTPGTTGRRPHGGDQGSQDATHKHICGPQTHNEASSVCVCM